MRYIYRFEAMTTPCELNFYCDSKDKADRLAQKIFKEVKRLEKKYNYFDPSSYLSAINQRETNILDRETKEIIKRAKYFYEKTDKTFDITIGTIKDIYTHFDKISQINIEKERLLKYIGCEHITIKRDKIYFDNPYTKMDFGGFVKEHSVDRSVKILKNHNINSGIVNFGGDIFVFGKKIDGEKYKIGIKDPNDPTKFATFVYLEDEALTTSASYERNFKIEGRVFSHIISPYKESDSNNLKRSISVISKNTVESGIFSTSLVINPMIKTTNRVIIL